MSEDDVEIALRGADAGWATGFEAGVLAAEVRRLRETLAGKAPAKGSWKVEALALRAELLRLDAEIAELRTRDERARATAHFWQQLRPHQPQMAATFVRLLDAQTNPYVDEELRQLLAEWRAHKDGE